MPNSNLLIQWSTGFGTAVRDPDVTLCLLKAQSDLSAQIVAHGNKQAGSQMMKWTYGSVEFRYLPCSGVPLYQATYNDLLDVTRGFFSKFDRDGVSKQVGLIKTPSDPSRAALIYFARAGIYAVGDPN